MDVLDQQFVRIQSLVDENRAGELLCAVKQMVRLQGRYLKDYGHYVKLISLIVGSEPSCRYKDWGDVPGNPCHIVEDAVSQYRRSELRTKLAFVGESYNVGMIEILGYRSQGWLERHVDCVRGVAVILSLGATSNFFFKTPRSVGDVELALRSGDVIMFDSSQSAAIEHGIRSFDDSTKPGWFDFDDFVRVCIQFREGPPLH